MNATRSIKEKYANRLSELIQEAEALVKAFKVIPAGTYETRYYAERYQWDSQRMQRWFSNCAAIFDAVALADGKLKDRIDAFMAGDPSPTSIKARIGILESLRENLGLGFLDSLTRRIEDNIAADYMGQAEALLSEGQSGEYDHVPAAVLAGAVLEKGLRTLCTRQTPELPILNAKGEPKMMGVLIDDLKKAGAFNELKAKQLRAWADIRNAAAHGQFEKFDRKMVEAMIPGINNFLADHLG